jgi:hypothetical protein
MSGSDLYIPRKKLLFPKQNYNVLSPNFHIHVSVSDLYIPTISLPRTDHGNITIVHRYMNVELGMRLQSFISGNICLKFLVQCMNSAIFLRLSLYHVLLLSQSFSRPISTRRGENWTPGCHDNC